MPTPLLTPARCDPEIRALVEPLRTRMRELGVTHGQLAIRIGCDRSRISRALSARALPPRHLLARIVEELGGDADAADRRWAQIRLRDQGARAAAAMIAAGGGPPPGISSYRDLLHALRDLLTVTGLSQREIARRSRLRRSTVGAVLRDEQSASLWTVIAIVRACGASQAAAQAWQDAWWRYGHPHQQACRQRRWEGHQRMLWRDRWW